MNKKTLFAVLGIVAIGGVSFALYQNSKQGDYLAASLNEEARRINSLQPSAAVILVNLKTSQKFKEKPGIQCAPAQGNALSVPYTSTTLPSGMKWVFPSPFVPRVPDPSQGGCLAGANARILRAFGLRIPRALESIPGFPASFSDQFKKKKRADESAGGGSNGHVVVQLWDVNGNPFPWIKAHAANNPATGFILTAKPASGSGPGHAFGIVSAMCDSSSFVATDENGDEVIYNYNPNTNTITGGGLGSGGMNPDFIITVTHYP